MSNDNFILSTKDFTILEAMCDNAFGHYDLLVPLIRRKIDRAIVVFRDDLPREIASINSRVVFSVNGGESDTRVLSTGQLTAPVGMVLPITAARGLALLGLGEGQEIVLTNA
jgi:regulator of nucleoside diphosphate kinase